MISLLPIQKNEIFDGFSLKSSINLEEIETIENILSSSLMLKRTVSIITSEDGSILTGKIVLLDANNIVISLLNYESISIDNKESINLNSIICIDIVSVENFLYDKYIEAKSIE